MASSIIQQGSGNRWYLRYIDYTPEEAWGAVNSGANFSQAKYFTFSKAVSWTGIFFTATVQSDTVHAHIVPVNSLEGKVISVNMRNTAAAVAIVRVYFLVNDPDVTVSWTT